MKKLSAALMCAFVVTGCATMPSADSVDEQSQNSAGATAMCFPLLPDEYPPRPEWLINVIDRALPESHSVYDIGGHCNLSDGKQLVSAIVNGDPYTEAFLILLEKDGSLIKTMPGKSANAGDISACWPLSMSGHIVSLGCYGPYEGGEDGPKTTDEHTDVNEVVDISELFE